MIMEKMKVILDSMVHSEGRTQERINPKKYQNAMCVVV